MEAGHHGADGSVQPSLLRGIVMEKPVPRAFDLGMIDFVEFEKEKENRFRPLSLKKSRSNAPPPKRPCLHPSENQAVNNDPDRFDFSKDDAYSEMSVQYVPKNTKKRAFNNFQAWLETRNRTFPDAQCPVDLLEPPWDQQAMAHWLPRFACETLVAGIPHRVYFPFCPGYFVAVVPLTLTVPTFWMQNKRNSAKCTPSWTPIFENFAKTASELR